MDKKNTAIGVLLLAAAIASFYFSAKLAAPAPSVNPANPGATPVTASAPAGTPSASPAAAKPAGATAAAPSAPSLSAAVAPAEYATLANDFIEVRFSNYGGAIKEIALKKYEHDKAKPGEPYVINQLRVDPALAFAIGEK